MCDEAWILKYWECTLKQQGEEMKAFFCADAQIRWHNTNERFTVEEFVRANCEYPGQWQGSVERIERSGDRVVTALRVWSKEASFHVVSFIALRGDKIQEIDEYWGGDGEAPKWRKELKIGSPIV